MLQLKPERFMADEFRAQPVSICGKALVADQSGALFWPSQRALIVADLDLALPARSPTPSGAARSVSGGLLRLAEVIDRYEPETVIVLGGSWQEAGAACELAGRDRAVLDMMQEDRRWIWIMPAHATAADGPPGGEVRPELTLDAIALRHRPREAPGSHEIAGHLRPAACVSIYGTRLRRPCFVSNGLRLIMPAFGSLAGGRNVLDDDFQALLGTRGLTVWMLGEEGLYPIAARLLRGD